MYDSFEVNVFLITMGLLLAAIFLGLGISLGRGYERISKKHSGQSDECGCDNSNVLHSGIDNDCDSAMGNIHGEESSRCDIRVPRIKEISNEELAIHLRSMKVTGISPSDWEKIFLEESAARLEELEMEEA